MTWYASVFVRVVYSLQVKFNRGLEFVHLDDVLVDLKLSPEVIEIPVPHYFLEDRAKVCPSAQLMNTCSGTGRQRELLGRSDGEVRDFAKCRRA